jgi:hypothetical protein
VTRAGSLITGHFNDVGDAQGLLLHKSPAPRYRAGGHQRAGAMDCCGAPLTGVPRPYEPLDERFPPFMKVISNSLTLSSPRAYHSGHAFTHKRVYRSLPTPIPPPAPLSVWGAVPESRLPSERLPRHHCLPATVHCYCTHGQSKSHVYFRDLPHEGRGLVFDHYAEVTNETRQP